MFTHFWIDFVTLLAVMNPIDVIPAYITLTDGLAPAARTRVLRRTILVSAAILLVFLILGELYMDALGVTLDALRIAGGLVILLVGLRMVFDDGRRPEATRETDATSRDIAVFPLAMPLIAGPNAITAIVLLTENALHNIPQQAGTAITLCIVLAIDYAVLKSAGPIHRFLGSTGTAVVARVTGLVLTALAVKVMILGFQNVFPALL
jgi:multiple antibiotic resistance protein